MKTRAQVVSTAVLWVSVIGFSLAADPQQKPMTEEQKAMQAKMDADQYAYESYMKDKDGKEYKGMIITYQRIKY